jgi:hypothetical protein
MPETPRLEITPQDIPEATSRAPESHISTGDIVGPYQQLARGMDKLGEGLEDMATTYAERAGAQAVTRDEQGNIHVDRMPIFGRAGDAYARAVRVAALAEGDGAAKRADIELREKYRDDPQGYQNAAQAYKDATVKQYTAAAGPEVGNAVGQAIDNTTTYTYRGLLNEKERLDLQRAENSIKAGREDARNDMMALARGGAPADGDAMLQAASKYTTLTDELARNPRLAYTQEERAEDLKKLTGDLGGQRYLYHIDETYKDKGYQAAVDDAKDVLTNPRYNGLTETQRQQYYAHAMGEVRVNEAVRRQDVGEVQNQLRDLKDRVALGQEVTPDEINGVRNAFDKLHYDAGVVAVDNAFRNKDLHDQFGRQPLGDQTRQHAALVGASAARDAYTSLLRRGYSEAAAAGIVGNLVVESGMRPTVPGDQGTSFGLAQWHAERFDALKAFAGRQGKSWTDPETQLDFLHHELQTSESVTGGLLRTATTPEQAAQIFAAGFERPKGTDYSQREAAARSIVAGTASDGSGGPGARSWEIANRAATIKTSATRQYDAIKADWDAGKGIADRQGLRDVIDAARETDNAELGAKAEALARAQDFVDQNKQLPLDQQARNETEIRRQLELGTKEFAGADMVLKQLQAKTEAIQKGIEKDPIATAVGNFPETWKTPAPLNLSDPRQFAIGLAQRAQIAQGAANNWRVPPLSVLDEADVQTVKAALANPDLGVKASIWSVLATIPEQNRSPTFEKIAKGDPNALAEAGAGSMMATDPEMAKSIMAGLQVMARNDHGILKQFEPKPGGAEGYDADLFKALPPTAYGSETRLDPTGNYAKVDQMIKARYAYLAANDPKGAEYSSARLNQAVADVTGGTVRLNGAKTVAPAPGMPQATFDGIMQGLTDRDLQGATNLNGVPLTANLLRQMGHLEAIGPGRYNVNLGGPGEKPIYAFAGWGDTPESAAPGGPRKFVLDLTGRQPAPPLMAQPIPLGGIVQGARRLIGAQGLREIRGADQAIVPGGIRG